MRISRYYLVFVLMLQFILVGSAKDIPGNDHLVTILDGIDGEEELSLLHNSSDKDSPVKLIQPDSASQVTTFTPTFVWHAVQSDSSVEYRLLIAKTDGKILFDQWVGQDTSYTISSSHYFEDLNPYYWTIYASFDNKQLQSPVWSFWVDQNIVTDLTVTDILLMNEKFDWNPGDEVKIRAIIQNSGPINAEGCFVTLYSGNINQNYFNYVAHRKTIALDTIFVSELKMNDPKSIILTAQLPYGFNHFFVRIDPAPGLKDVIYSNNYLKGIKIQTEDRILCLDGLFIIYKNYVDPETGEKRLGQNDLKQLYQNITNFQRYFWDHTHILKINIDTLHVNRLMTDENFAFQDEQWGYFLPPDEVAVDLTQRNIAEFGYDFIFVNYSWWNSNTSWSGYSGYTLKYQKLLGKELSLLAQPVTHGQIENEMTAIHEFLHLLDYFFEQNGEQGFYSPHHRTLFTTFDKDKDYFDWILETWQTSKWFNLKNGRLIQKKEIAGVYEPAKISLVPKTLILSQNYPNPFNKITTIIYKIPQFKSTSNRFKVNLSIYDILGNRIRILVNEIQKPGTYRVYWDGKDQQGNDIASGIYFYELKGGQQRQVKKLLYIR